MSARKMNRPGQMPFVHTRVAALGLSVAEHVRAYGGVGVLCGPAGSGKTMIMQAFTERCEAAVLLEAHPGWRAGALVRALCTRLSQPATGSLHSLYERCISALREHDCLLLVDEAGLLPVCTLETLRRLHDLSGAGLLLAGTPRLLTQLRGTPQAPSQLYSRAGMVLDLATCPAQEKEDDSDFRAVLSAMLNTYGGPETLTDAVRDAFRIQAGGNWRRLMLLIQGSVRATRSTEGGLTPALVRACARILL